MLREDGEDKATSKHWEGDTGASCSKEMGSQDATQASPGAEAQLSQTSTRPQVLRPGKKGGEGFLKVEVELAMGAETLG